MIIVCCNEYVSYQYAKGVTLNKNLAVDQVSVQIHQFYPIPRQDSVGYLYNPLGIDSFSPEIVIHQ
jgi:hypothetical protein